MTTYNKVNLDEINEGAILSALSMGGWGIVFSPADRSKINETHYIEERRNSDERNATEVY